MREFNIWTQEDYEAAAVAAIDCIIHIWDDAVITIHGSEHDNRFCEINAHDNAVVKAYGFISVDAYDNSHVELHDNTYGYAYDNATVEVFNTACVDACSDNVTIVRHSDECQIIN